jgi:RecA-family ATPase
MFSDPLEQGNHGAYTVKYHTPKPNGKAELDQKEVLPKEPFPWTNMSNWDNEPTPQREWAVLNRVPLRQVTLFSGEGAVGKSIVELQLCAAHPLSKEWLGSLPEPGGAFYIGAEDDEKEIHIRLASILAHYEARYSDLVAGGFRMISLCGDDAILGAPNRNGVIEPTDLYRRLYEQAGDLKPKHIGIDTSADVYAGSEIDRSQVRQFISLLRRMAIAANGSVVLLSHPSLTGIASGSGLSGSTAWHNSVRSRFYMTSPKAEAGEQPDTDLRELVFKKSNYGPINDSLALQYQHGLFLPIGGVSSLDKAAYEMKVEDLFLTLLRKLTERGTTLSPAPTSHSYAPKLIADEPEAKAARVRKDALKAAMNRLLDRNRIHSEEVGRAGREKQVLHYGPK